MKLLEDSKGSLTPPSESGTMYNSMLSTRKTGGGDDSTAGMKSTPKSKSFQNDTHEPLELNTGEAIYLDFQEEGHSSCVLEGINNLRKQGQFCDIILVVDDHEILVHRAVLAACSPYLFDFLSVLEETTEQQPTYKLKNIPFDGFHFLLDFMYTGRLHVPLENVPAVYATAIILKMESATRICAGFLSEHLTASNCLGIRRFTKDVAFKKAVDEYIRSNLTDIMQSKSFFGLTDLQVEVVGLDESITNETMERRLFSLVLDWVKINLNDLKPKMERLIEKVNVLYLDSDNTLRDCAEVEDTVLNKADALVQDYKKARKRDKFPAKAKIQSSTNGNGQSFHRFNLNPEEAVSVAEREWSIVVTRQISENSFLAIALVDGRLMAITVHLRAITSTNGDSKGASTEPDSPPVITSSKSRMSPVLKKTSITPLKLMSTARCALGAVELNGKLVVCGGYDRGECLKSVEAYTIKTNEWCKMPDMNRARGRFDAGVVNGAIYVCGGSDGQRELSCVEKYDAAAQKWVYVTKMQKERSSHGVVSLNDKLYVIGGLEGQRSTSTCEVYDPAANTWTRIASLTTARSQACVCAAGGLLYAIGGTDQWSPLNSVEAYDPAINTWTPRANLNSARRGAGAGLVDGQIMVVGGSDGTQSLVTSELYDFDTNTWSVGPSLIFPRANLSVATVGHTMFAVGGFDGKRFLSNVEWFDQENNEWIGHALKQMPDEKCAQSTNQEVFNGGGECNGDAASKQNKADKPEHKEINGSSDYETNKSS